MLKSKINYTTTFINMHYPGYILFKRTYINIDNKKISAIPILWQVINDYTNNSSSISALYFKDSNITLTDSGLIENSVPEAHHIKKETFTSYDVSNTRATILTNDNGLIVGGIIKNLENTKDRIVFECYSFNNIKNSIDSILDTIELSMYGIDNRGFFLYNDDIVGDLYMISDGNNMGNYIFIVPIVKNSDGIFYRNAGLYKFFSESIIIDSNNCDQSDISYNVNIKCWREISEETWNYNTANLSMQYNQILNKIVVAFDKDKILFTDAYLIRFLKSPQKIIENTTWYSCDVNNSGDAFIALGNIRYSLNKHHTRNFIIFSNQSDKVMQELTYPDFLEYEKINNNISLTLNKAVKYENTFVYMQFLSNDTENNVIPEFYVYCLKDGFQSNWTSLEKLINQPGADYIHSYNVNKSCFDISNCRAITDYAVARKNPDSFIYMRNFYVSDNLINVETRSFIYDNKKVEFDVTYGDGGYYKGNGYKFEHNIDDCGFINLNLITSNNTDNFHFGVAFIANNRLYTGLINEDIQEVMDTTFQIDTENYKYTIAMINTYFIFANKQAFLIGIHDTKNPSKISFIKQGEVIGNNNNIAVLDLNDWKSKIFFSDFSNISFSLTNGYIDITNSGNDLGPTVIYFCLVTNKNYTDISEQSAGIYVYYSKDNRKSKWGRLIYKKNNDNYNYNKEVIVSNNAKITYCQENDTLYIFDNDYNKITKFHFDKNKHEDYIDYNLFQ